MVQAVEKVRARLSRAVGALEAARIPYAVVGGNAVAAWVSRVDESAARNTRDVNILVRRDDYDRVRSAIEGVGFVHTDAFGRELFLDGPGGKASEAVHLLFANEKMAPQEALPNPDVTESEDAGSFRVLALPALVQIKLTAFREKDRTHLRDLIDVGLVDDTWYPRFPQELAERLKSLIDTPGG
jgi:hypothetical protein